MVVATIHGRTKLGMPFMTNVVEMSKCLAYLFSLSRNSLRQENELHEFAELVEAQFKIKKLKIHFSKLQFSFLICTAKKAKLEIIHFFLPSPITQVSPKAICLFSKVTYFDNLDKSLPTS